MSRLDDLIAAIPPGRRAALAERAGRDPVRAWLAREGRDAAWVLVQWCRDQIAQLPRYGWTDARHMAIIDAFAAFAAAFAREPEAPAVWVELVAAVPGYKPAIARGIVGAMPESPQTLAAIRDGLTTLAIPHRRLLATRLRASGALTPEQAVTWFADPALRPLAEEYFAPGLAEHEDLLRERLVDAKPGEREAIVRLLRRIDPKLSLTGAHDASTDGELQARLREQPDDATTAEVWADSLIDRQDPRGELIALELAIRATDDPERALALSQAQAKVVAAHRKALWNKPGGFPFREKYRGRRALAFASDWNHTMRGKVEGLVERVQAFVETVTDVRAPRHVFVRRRYDPLAQSAPLEDVPADTRALVAALGGDAIALADKHGGFIRREAVREPLADAAAFRDVLAREPDHTLEYQFQLVAPGTTTLLPHQDGAHYTHGEPLHSSLRLYLAGRDIQLHLAFPFESETDPRFVEIYEAICETLGRVMTPSRWLRLDPSADGKKLTSKRFRFG